MTLDDCAATRETIDRNWFAGFFEGPMLDVWRAAVPPEMTTAEVEFLQRQLELVAGARVLDVACGLGRHSLELAARGFRPTGIDQSEPALDEARALAGARGLAVEFLHADMRTLPPLAPFPAAFALGNSFGYLGPDGARAQFAAVAAALAPGGRFVLDVGYLAETVLPHLRPREWSPVGDLLFLEENRYLPLESCIETTYTVLRGPERCTRKGWQWVFTIREVLEMLRAAGLEPLAVLQSTRGEPFTMGSAQIGYFVARKRW